MSCITAEAQPIESIGDALRRVACAVTSPVRAMLTRQRQVRRFLDFTTIDRHTLDDMGLARIRFGAAPVNHDRPSDVA